MANKEQLAAINAPSNIDLVITAGAGSGKTSVLSERVFRLIDSGEIQPESLLVLTFTNNASYEMKSRILKRFGKDHPLYPRMLSCHVQSFDSFRAYLVRAYAEKLNVPKTFVVMPESIEQEKRSHFVEEVVEECYVDPKKREDLIGFLTKFGFKNTEKVNQCVLYLSNKLSALSPNKREEYFNSYDGRFFSEAGLRDIYVDQIHALMEDLRSVLREAAFVNAHSRSIEENLEKVDLDGLRRSFSLPGEWKRDLHGVHIDVLGCDFWAFLPELFESLCGLLDEDVFCAASKAAELLEDHEEDFSLRMPKKPPLEQAEHNRLKTVYAALKNASRILISLVEIGDFETAKGKALWCKDEEVFLLRLAKEVSDRLGDYKRSVNAFSFDDIGFMAIKLFEDESLVECADEIAGRFDYIMVDEYQDNNDAQEDLLNGLTRRRKDGSRAHLFCVGDAKQAIYAFRGSNVALIRERAKRYASAPDGEVIPMNKNYRSAKRLLSDINYIFSSYMRMDNGGIDYLDPAERLQYDDSVNLYDQDAGNYGVRRIVPPSAFALQKKKLGLEISSPATYEAMAILNDIQAKIKDGYLIFDRGMKPKGFRKCDYSDFAILVRRKRQIPIYQSLFAANGIPLNNQLSVDLREVSPTILLRSLLGLMANRLYGEKRDELHLFASVARSYAFRYDDTTLHRILTGVGIEGEYTDEEKASIAVHADPIMQRIDVFVETHRESSFEEILMDLIDEFDVVSALPRLGDTEAYISKIESLFAMSLSEKDLGAGLSDFIAFFDSLDDFGIALTSEQLSESKNAVDLMTIHASKGLERKIVYMPSSESGIGGGGDARNEPPFAFSLEEGICFPYLGFEIPKDISPDKEIGGSIETIRTLGRRALIKFDEAQEHVRLLYVALTRAENAFYLVGSDKGSCGYVMMNDLPKRLEFNPAFIEAAKKNGSFDGKAYAKLVDLDARLSNFTLPLGKNDIDDAYDLAKDLFARLVLEPLRQMRGEFLFEFLLPIYEDYRQRFLSRKDDVDFLARIYAGAFYPRRKGIDTLGALMDSLGSGVEEVLEDVDPSSLAGATIETWKRRLAKFAKGIDAYALPEFAPFLAKSNKEERTPGSPQAQALFIDTLLPVFAKVFDGVTYLAYESYATAGYGDEVTVFDDADYAGKKFVAAPELPELTINDDPIEFEAIERKRASKRSADADAIDPLILERGTHLHRLLQLSKLDENNLDFIADPKEKEMVLRCLRLELLQKAKKGTAYSEYGYYDTDFDTTGSIDLLFFEGDGTCHIVDYKSYDIDDPAYAEQLHVYRRNVARIFNLKESDIHLHLLSIRKALIKDIA